MTIILLTIFFISFLGFQIPVLISLLQTHQISNTTSKTLKAARRFRSTGSKLQLTFHKSVVDNIQ